MCINAHTHTLTHCVKKKRTHARAILATCYPPINFSSRFGKHWCTNFAQKFGAISARTAQRQPSAHPDRWLQNCAGVVGVPTSWCQKSRLTSMCFSTEDAVEVNVIISQRHVYNINQSHAVINSLLGCHTHEQSSNDSGLTRGDAGVVPSRGYRRGPRAQVNALRSQKVRRRMLTHTHTRSMKYHYVSGFIICC